MHNEGILISIIIPIYNVERYIENTLKSLIYQSNYSFEVILVDDGSQDKSRDIAVTMLKDSTISFTIIKQRNAGQGIARNSGFAAAHGKWIMFLDSDDTLQFFAIDHLAAIVQDHPNVDAIFSNFQRVSEDNVFAVAQRKDQKEIILHNDIIVSFLKRDRNLLVPGTLYRTKFISENKLLHRGIRWSEDQCFQWEVLNKVQNALYSDCVLYNYLTRQGSIMDATKVDAMLTAYSEFSIISGNMTDEIARKYLIPRWVLGCLHIVAIRKDKVGWRTVWKNMNGEKCMLTLVGFPDIKVKIVALIGLINQKILFKLLGQSHF